MTLGRRSRLAPEVRAAYLAPYDSWDHRRAIYDFVADIPTSPRHATWKTLADIEARLATLADRPICLIWGGRDWCFTADSLNRFTRVWPRAEVHQLADVGHWVVEDAPQEADSLLSTFLSREVASL
jgi:haloalkane dehalogenase